MTIEFFRNTVNPNKVIYFVFDENARTLVFETI